jgi:hypothetical protein
VAAVRDGTPGRTATSDPIFYPPVAFSLRQAPLALPVGGREGKSLGKLVAAPDIKKKLRLTEVKGTVTFGTKRRGLRMTWSAAAQHAGKFKLSAATERAWPGNCRRSAANTRSAARLSDLCCGPSATASVPGTPLRAKPFACFNARTAASASGTIEAPQLAT